MQHVPRGLTKKNQRAKYVVVRTDETTGTSTHMQMVFIYRCVKNWQMRSINTAHGIADQILTVLSELGIDKKHTLLSSQENMFLGDFVVLDFK